MTPNQLADLIERTSVRAYQEGRRRVTFVGTFADNDDQQSWATLLRDGNQFLEEITLRELEFDGSYDPENMPPVGTEFRAVLQKPAPDAVANLLLPPAIDILLDDLNHVRLVRVAKFSKEHEFSTFRAFFRPWDEANGVLPKVNPALPDARQFSRDFTGNGIVPEDVRPWLLHSPPQEESRTFVSWQNLATERLLGALADRVDDQDGVPYFHLNGPPVVGFSLDDGNRAHLHERVQKAARWVYDGEKRDADVRHLLYSVELARSYRASGPTSLGLNALDSAMSAYRAYIKSKSAETLDVISRLRSSIVDETHKISEKAREFTKNMWRDAVISSFPFVFRIVNSSGQANNYDTSRYLALGAAIFLLISIFSQWYLNERWLDSQSKSQEIWRLDLNTALTEDEINRMVKDPITRTKFDYRMIGVVISIVYLTLIGGLFTYFRGDWQLG